MGECFGTTDIVAAKRLVDSVESGLLVLHHSGVANCGVFFQVTTNTLGTKQTSSHLNTENKQYLALIVVGSETAWELQVLLTKSKVGLCCHVGQADEWQNSCMAYRLWESLDCVPDSLLATAAKWSPRVEKPSGRRESIPGPGAFLVMHSTPTPPLPLDLLG